MGVFLADPTEDVTTLRTTHLITSKVSFNLNLTHWAPRDSQTWMFLVIVLLTGFTSMPIVFALVTHLCLAINANHFLRFNITNLKLFTAPHIGTVPDVRITCMELQLSQFPFLLNINVFGLF